MARGENGNNLRVQLFTEFLDTGNEGQDFNIIDEVKFYEHLNDLERERAAATARRLDTAQLLKEVEDEIAAKRAKEDERSAQQQKKVLALEEELYKLRKEVPALNEKDRKTNEKKQKQVEKQIELQKKRNDAEKKFLEYADKAADRHPKADEYAAARRTGKEVFAAGLADLNFKEMFAGAKKALTGGEVGFGGVIKSLDTMVNKLGELGSKLDSTIEEIVKYKSDWDTRLFGSGQSHTSVVDAVRNAVGISPFVKEADVMKNLDAAIDKGIAYNVEQRAFLQTIRDDIASTFDAFDATLLNIIRVQQSDSTAARLGMETTLNQYLNNMFKNTEYLSNVSDSVTSALYQATSLLSSEASIGFEYQVQKWLGSLYSVGMSSSAVSQIAEALGKAASGDVSATTSGAGKLLVMAASQAGLPYSELLTQGINDSEISSLMESMVKYLQQIANSNKVVQTQYAQVYGLSTADIQAVRNLRSEDIANIARSNLDYGGSIAALNQMARTVGQRMSLGEMLSNARENLEYTISAGIADNPALYALWKISGMLDQYMGGINIPTVMALGTGVDLEASVADLMRVGTMSASLLGGIGGILGSLGDAFSGQGLAGTLSRLGVASSASTVSRGSGITTLTTGITSGQSGSSMVGNTAGGDLSGAYLASAETQKQELQVKGEDEVDIKTINDNIVSIVTLLSDVIDGTNSLHVVLDKVGETGGTPQGMTPVLNG